MKLWFWKKMMWVYFSTLRRFDMWVFWEIAHRMYKLETGKDFPKFESRMAEAELDE
jgi:hypothetical protein